MQCLIVHVDPQNRSLPNPDGRSSLVQSYSRTIALLYSVEIDA